MGNFEKEISKIAIDKRCIQSDEGKFCTSRVGACFFGVPTDELYGRIPLHSIPDNVAAIHFLMGSDQQQLVAAFAHSHYCKTVDTLTIGSSSYSREFPLDYSAAIAALRDAVCPQLKRLSVGEWVLFANEHCAYGRLGNITPVLQQLSHIEVLEIWGNFEITEAINFPNLKDLSVILNDSITYINGGLISNATLSILMSCCYPNLEEIFFDLECDEDDSGYTFSDIFLAGENLPKLRRLEITGGFATGEKENLIASPLYKKVKTKFLDDMI